MRRFVEVNYPGRILLCEANQWPKDVREYFGGGDNGRGDEFHMAFHFPLMPRIFMALKCADATPIRWALDNTPPIPHEAQWCTFLRNHDELTLEMVTEEERQWMWQQYAPQPRMRLNLGIRRRLAPLLDNDRRLIELANSLLFSLPGTPIIYYAMKSEWVITSPCPTERLRLPCSGTSLSRVLTIQQPVLPSLISPVDFGQ
jgi:maltose alpha-D-glucosyltransferase/alpha-amylase